MMEDHAEVFCYELWRSWSPEWKFSKRDWNEATKSWKNPQFTEIVLHYYRTRWGGALSLRAYKDLQARLDKTPKAKISVPAIHVQGSADASDLAAGSEEQAEVPSGSFTTLRMTASAEARTANSDSG
jgi:hypothetical protein